MKSKFVTLGVLVILILVSIATVLYFTADKKEESIPVESDASILSVSAPSTATSSDLQGSSTGEVTSEVSKNKWNPDSIEMKNGLTFVKMNEPLTLHSRKYGQGEARDEQALSLGWNGDLTVTVNKAQLLDYDPSDSSAWNDMFASFAESMDFNSPAVLLLEIEVKNIDAAQGFGVKYDFHPNYRLQSTEFYSKAFADTPGQFDFLGEYISNEAYFSAHSVGDDYYTFSLPEGESVTFEYAFYISREALDYSPLYFNPAGASSKAFCGIELDKIEEG